MFRLFITDIELSSKKMARMFIANIIICAITSIIALGVAGFTFYKYNKNVEYTATVEKGLSRALDERASFRIEKERLEVELNTLSIQNKKLEEDKNELNKKIKSLESKNKELTNKTIESKPKPKATVKKVKPKTVSNLTVPNYFDISRFKYAYDLDITKKHDKYMKHSMDISHVEEAIKVLKHNNAKFDPHVLLAIYAFESKFNHGLKTGSGSGYGQLIYTTGKWRYETILRKGTYKRDMALDPIINIQITADYFADIVRERKGDLYESLRRYNGNAIGDLYMRKISQTLVKYTGKDLEYYNLQSKKHYR